VIDYRSQGLANKKPETQQIVLVKKVELRVSSTKEFGMDLVEGI
jgi:hypothetical protein